MSEKTTLRPSRIEVLETLLSLTIRVPPVSNHAGPRSGIRREGEYLAALAESVSAAVGEPVKFTTSLINSDGIHAVMIRKNSELAEDTLFPLKQVKAAVKAVASFVDPTGVPFDD